MSAGNPLGFNNWLNQSGNGGDDAWDDVELGQFNQLKDDDGTHITTIQNTAEQNAALWRIYQRSRVEYICSSFKEGSNGC